MPAELHNSDSSPATTSAWSDKMKSSRNREQELVKAMLRNMAKKATTEKESKPNATSKKTCICAPTSHAGSFRCHFHRTVTTPKSERLVHDLSGKENSLCKNSGKINKHMQPQLSRFGRAAIAQLPQESQSMTIALATQENSN